MAKLILLDALGTLLALAPPAPLLREALRERLGAEVALADAERAMAAEIGYYRAHLDTARDAVSLAELRAGCAHVVRDVLGEVAPVGSAPIDVIRDALLAALRFSPYDDALPFLRTARAAGHRLIVVSNWDVSLHDVLRRSGLAPWLDGVITSAEAGARKPAAEIFHAALAAAGGVAPSEAVHVGDSLAEDVAGARAAGIDAVLVLRTGRPPPPAVRSVRRLTELCAA